MRKIIRENQIFFGLFFLWILVSLVFIYFQHKGYFVLYFAMERKETADLIFTYITKMGEAGAIGIGALILLFVRIRYGMILPIIGLSVLTLSLTLKRFFAQPRPKTFFHKMVENLEITLPDMYVNLGFNSFPSGHTMSAFALYGFMALCFKNKFLGILFFLIALAVGISRMILTQHFLEDVIAGSLLGIFIALLFYRIQLRSKFDETKWYNRSIVSFIKKKS